eukprot:5169507-Amphidinium_carterae.1
MTEILAYLRMNVMKQMAPPTATAMTSCPVKTNTPTMRRISNHSSDEFVPREPHKFSATKPEPAKNNKLEMKKRGK